ncbi:MAG TPA: tyrosine-type recombinase/integrase [Smithella sp.]|nr:tyrosine-type recombinase/integrase [Smithella sp.]
MKQKWIATAHKGLRYFEHDTRKHGKRFDRYYSIRFRVDRRLHTFGVGWVSDGIPEAVRQEDPGLGFEEYCLKLLRQYKVNAKTGTGPTSPREKRLIEKEKEKQVQEEKARLEKENMTFGYYFEKKYFPTYQTGRKKSTSRKAQEHFQNWINPVIGNTPLKDIKPFAIEKIKKNILDGGKAPRTLQYILATIRHAWNTARINGLVVGDSPTKNVQIPKIDNKRVRFLTHKEAENLLKSLKEEDVLTYYISLLSLQTGLRFGEIAKLKWGHIDLDKGIIEVVDPKGNPTRIVYMTGKIKAMFDKMERRKPDDYVFFKDGAQLKDTPKVFFKVVDELGLNDGVSDSRRKVVFHSLRHTFASWHVMAGTDIYTVKKLMGHSNIAMTERYSHLAPEALQNATRTLEKAINKAGHKKIGQVVKFQK